MKKLLRRTFTLLALLGFDAKVFAGFLSGLPRFLVDYRRMKQQRGTNTEFSFGTLTPVLGEWTQASGSSSGAYFHQDLLVARKIYEARPARHIDIGSRIDGFVAHVSVFREIEVFDIRPQHGSVPNIVFRQYDMRQLPKEMHECCDSVSSLHAIEHFGLGRYGDPVDYNGHLKAIDSIYGLLRPRGKFYFSVPIGKQRIEFNAHRVFDFSYLMSLFSGRFDLVSFSYVNDEGDLVSNPPLEQHAIKDNFGCHLGCGIFELSKI